MFLDQSNALDVEDGAIPKDFAITFKLHPGGGGNGTGQSLPDNGKETRRFSSTELISSTIDMKISPVAENIITLILY